MSNKFRLEEIAMGTYEINVPSYETIHEMSLVKSYDYVDTSISYDNDYELRRLLDDNPSVKVISKIAPQMTDQYEFMVSNHLRCLNRNKIDIMLIHNPRSDWKDLAKKLNSDKRFIEVGVSNFSIMQLNEYMKVIGRYPKYNEIEINPNYYDKELIEFCHDRGIKIIAYAILGGKYNARKNIARYTLPYLLAFAAKNAEIVIVRSDSHFRLNRTISLLKNIENLVEDPNRLLDRGSSESKSIIPEVYDLPEVYTIDESLSDADYKYDTIVGDGLIPDTAIISSKESLKFVKEVDNSIQSSDLIGLLSYINSTDGVPTYEFVSDYRVYFRYKLHEFMTKSGFKSIDDDSESGRSYYSRSLYYEKFLHRSGEANVIMSVNLVGENNKPTKVTTNGPTRIVLLAQSSGRVKSSEDGEKNK